jgi:hypothetical protein
LFLLLVEVGVEPCLVVSKARKQVGAAIVVGMDRHAIDLERQAMGRERIVQGRVVVRRIEPGFDFLP